MPEFYKNPYDTEFYAISEDTVIQITVLEKQEYTDYHFQKYPRNIFNWPPDNYGSLVEITKEQFREAHVTFSGASFRTINIMTDFYLSPHKAEKDGS